MIFACTPIQIGMNVQRFHDRAAKVPSGRDQRSRGRDAIHGRNVMEVSWASRGVVRNDRPGHRQRYLGMEVQEVGMEDPDGTRESIE